MKESIPEDTAVGGWSEDGLHQRGVRRIGLVRTQYRLQGRVGDWMQSGYVVKTFGSTVTHYWSFSFFCEGTILYIYIFVLFILGIVSLKTY